MKFCLIEPKDQSMIQMDPMKYQDMNTPLKIIMFLEDITKLEQKTYLWLYL